MDKESGQFLGLAYIWFIKEESAQLAVKEMNGKVLYMHFSLDYQPYQVSKLDVDVLRSGFVVQFFDGRFIYVTIAKPGSSKIRRNSAPYKF